MNAEFQPNGYIQKLIDQHGPNSMEVVKAIEFWGSDAGEFVVIDESLTAGLPPAALGGGVFEERDIRQERDDHRQ